MNNLPFRKRSVRLRGFSAEELLGAVHGGRLEHYILTRAKCDVWLDHWSMDGFSVDTGRYSFPVRVVGSFSPRKLCIGYMRRLTASTWVNGLTADDHTIEFYPEGTELNYRAAPHGQWVVIEFDEQALQLAACAQLGHDIDLPWKHVMSFRVADSVRSLLDRMINRLWHHPISGTLMVEPILRAIAEILDGLQRKIPTVTHQKITPCARSAPACRRISARKSQRPFRPSSTCRGCRNNRANAATYFHQRLRSYAAAVGALLCSAPREETSTGYGLPVVHGGGNRQ